MKLTRRNLALPLLALAWVAGAHSADLRPPTLAELYSEEDIHDTAISPSGRYLAIALRQPASEVVLVHDLDTGQTTIPNLTLLCGAPTNHRFCTSPDKRVHTVR
jgi:hypothetical protein